VLLERGDLPAHGRLGQRELVGRFREAEMARRGLEGFELGERRQVVVAHRRGPRFAFLFRMQSIQEYRLSMRTI